MTSAPDRDRDNVLAEPDPVQRAKKVGELIDSYQKHVAQLAVVRQQAVDELLAANWTAVEIARLLGITRSRVYQIHRRT